MTVQQDQLVALRERVVWAEERMDTMWEILLVLEHTQENPIMVDEESDRETVVSDGLGEELEVEENEVAIPIPVLGWLVPICHRGRPLVGFPWSKPSTQTSMRLAIRYGSRRTRTLNQASWPHRASRGGQLE